MKRKSPKYQHILEVIILLGIIVIINIIVSFKFFRLDLTEDKIHSLNEKTIEFLQYEVEDVINIELYLTGDLPPIVEKLKRNIEERLNEFKAYAGNKVKYVYVDIEEDPNLTNERIKEMIDQKMYPSTITIMDQGSKIDKMIWPIAIIRYGTKTEYINFMDGQQRVSVSLIDAAVNNLEYRFMSAFWKLAGKPRQTISFLKGHGELSSVERYSVARQLFDFYNIDTVAITQFDKEKGYAFEKLNALDGKDMIIIAKPKYAFTEKELFVLDQYIMKGGKVIWAIDMINDYEDSLYVANTFYTQTEYNSELASLEKMIYKYGVGIKMDIVANQMCAPRLRNDIRWNKNIPKGQGVIPKWYLYPWVTQEDSELLKNVPRVKLKYPSSLKENTGVDVQKTVLLSSDVKHKIMPPTLRITYDDAEKLYNPEVITGNQFSGERVPLAYLLEGEFTSIVASSSLSPDLQMFLDKSGYFFKKQSVHTSMAVIGDGDIMRDEVFFFDGQTHQPYAQLLQPIREKDPLIASDISIEPIFNGEKMYGNTVFMHNLVDKMLGNEYLIPLRSRMKTPRFLNYDEIELNRKHWQMVNLIFPLIIVVLLGIIQFFIRKKRYAV
jgi:gliding-associated putative ABC transporter substrate-binding component GldG